MDSLSQWEVREGNLEGEILYWDPEGYVKEGSGNGNLSP